MKAGAKNFRLFYCTSQNNPYICSAQHLIQATRYSPTDSRWHFLCLSVNHISSDPRVECLMASQPVSGVEQRESGTFVF